MQATIPERGTPGCPVRPLALVAWAALTVTAQPLITSHGTLVPFLVLTAPEAASRCA